MLVRGWLHGNSVLLTGASTTLIDTGYHTGVDDLSAWIAERTGSRHVDEIVLTHAHSDHAGGVAAIHAATGARVRASTATAALAEAWDERRLWLGPSGQQLPIFAVHAPFEVGDTLTLSGGAWQVIGTPGHMTSAVALFEPSAGVLITGDALWEHGLGMLDPWIEGEGCVDDAAAALDRLAALPGVAVVVPGHGAPFTDLHGAIGRARARLDAVRADPEASRRMVALGGLAFLALARPELSRDEVIRLVRAAVEDHPPRNPGAEDAEAIVQRALATLAARGAATPG